MDYSSLQILSELRDDPALREFVLEANGGSMFPTIVKGDRLHLARCRNSDINPGDIILAQDPYGRFLIHRVVQISPALRTRGDAMDSDDAERMDSIAIVRNIEKTFRSRLRRFMIHTRKIFYAK